MNHAQKNAWFGLINCAIALVFFFTFFLCRFFHIPVSSLRSAPQPSNLEVFFRSVLPFWPLVLPVIALALLLLPRKKQSPAEPDFDEMDATIQNKAIRIAFTSIWLLWPLALLLTIPMLGEAAYPIAAFCVFVYLVIFIVCMTIYFLTKIILYRKQLKGGPA